MQHFMAGTANKSTLEVGVYFAGGRPEKRVFNSR